MSVEKGIWGCGEKIFCCSCDSRFGFSLVRDRRGALHAFRDLDRREGRRENRGIVIFIYKGHID